MNERRRRIVDDAMLRDTLADIVLEASKEELVEALGEEEFVAEAERGRDLVLQALQKAGFGAVAEDTALQLHQGLGTMLKLLKRRDGLSDAKLAEEARIDEEELRRITLDPIYEPSPRTIYRLEQFFDLPKRSIAILAGAVKVEDSAFTHDVVQFAAKSASIGRLTREERRHLNQFVKLLGEFTERTSKR